jgi:hypothetical protein
MRFGALPSVAVDPLEVAEDSLDKSSAGWRVAEVRSAGSARRGKRQADQFLGSGKEPIEEIDIEAILHV